jgi:hypothetical protein
MGTTKAERMLTDAQRRKIFAASHELGWDDVKLHEELERVIGVESLRDLSLHDAKLFIDYQVSEDASSGRHRAMSAQVDGTRQGPRPENLIELATPAQQQYIDDLLAALQWNRQAEYFLGCLKKATGRTTIRTRREAAVAIEVLKSVRARREGRPAEADRENDTEAGGQ